MTQALVADSDVGSDLLATDLQATLVELIDLSLQAKHAHWNVVGPAFKPVHEFLDEMTDEYRGWYDDVAERMAALRIASDGQSATVAATSGLAPMPAGPIADRIVLAAFDDRLTEIAARIRERAGRMEGDLASQDLLIEILRGIDKQHWMVRAHLD